MPLTLHPKDLGLKLARTLKTKKRYESNPKDVKTEAPLQEACERWLETRGIAYLHIPAYLLNAGFNGGPTSGPAVWARNRAAKDVRGFPDLCIFHPNRLNYLVTELKSKTGTLTDSQEKWKDALGGHVFRNFDDWCECVEKWLNNSNGG